MRREHENDVPAFQCRSSPREWLRRVLVRRAAKSPSEQDAQTRRLPRPSACAAESAMLRAHPQRYRAAIHQCFCPPLRSSMKARHPCFVSTRSSSATATPHFLANASAAGVASPSASKAIFSGGPFCSTRRSSCCPTTSRDHDRQSARARERPHIAITQAGTIKASRQQFRKSIFQGTQCFRRQLFGADLD